MQLVNWIEPLLEWLWNNKDYILKQEENNIERPGDRYGFQVFYPEYGGIPEEIAQNLSDFHQDIINKYTVFYLQSYANKNEFSQKMCNVLTNSTVIF